MRRNRSLVRAIAAPTSAPPSPQTPARGSGGRNNGRFTVNGLRITTPGAWEVMYRVLKLNQVENALPGKTSISVCWRITAFPCLLKSSRHILAFSRLSRDLSLEFVLFCISGQWNISSRSCVCLGEGRGGGGCPSSQ